MRSSKEVALHYDKNGLAYDSINNLYTGTSMHHYDNGKVKSESNFVDGVRKGEWKVYGYSGEIIQSGKYMDSKELNMEELQNIKCDRIEINLWNESKDITYMDIYIINPYDSLKISYKDSLKKLISKKHAEVISIEELRVSEVPVK